MDDAPLSPSIFLSPRISADLDASLDAIEELLLSVDDVDDGRCAASAFSASPPTEFNHTTSSNNHFITNAVHMELQENAKLPTFNLSVDRTNTSWHVPAPRGRRRGAAQRRIMSIGSDNSSSFPLSPTSKLMGQSHHNLTEEQHLDAATYHAIDEMLRLNDHDLDLSLGDTKLCEFFLDGDDRTSAALAYSVASAGMPQLPASTSMEDVTNIPTRPLPSNSPLLPYNRVKPLPIPALKTSPSLPNRQDLLISEGAVAVSTGSTANVSSSTLNMRAASSSGITDCQHVAPSSTQTVSSVVLLPQTIPDPLVHQPTSTSFSNSAYTSLAPKYVIPPTPPPSLPNHAVAKPPSQPFASQRLATPTQYASLHAAAHSHSNASIRYATGQRSKFGFGENHTVPSVPAPPKHNAKSHPFLNANSKVEAFEATVMSPSQSGPQYERKKQRAKDARVKLNKSMDELALAIDLAGSQSKMRFDYVVKTSTCKNPQVAPSAGSTAAPNTLPQHPLANLMDLTIQQAASAKKWDRPSFVGLSASIINSLNAQCEGLMREVARLRNVARRDIMIADNGSASSTQSCTPQKIVDETCAPQHDQPVHAAKKLKLDSPNDANYTAAETQLCRAMALKEQQRCDAIHNTLGTPSLLQCFASFLDPSTLCKCLCVSKGWRSQNIFQSNDLWLNLCIKRYGAVTLRKWQDGEEEGMLSQYKVNNDTLKLYRQMAVKNVKPNCPMEGALFLGGSTTGGLVNCWVSLVDRSNGETSRSVMQGKILNGKMKQYYAPMPVVELRLLVQNTGYSKGVIVIPNQQFAVDASTRRTGEKMLEIHGDHRFKSRALHIYGRRASTSRGSSGEGGKSSLNNEICHLRLFESAILSVHIHAKGCSTISKFRNRSKRIQLLVSMDGIIRQLVIPFHCMNEHNLKQIVN